MELTRCWTLRVSNQGGDPVTEQQLLRMAKRRLALRELHRVELPLVGDAFELAGAAVCEREPGPGDEVLHRTGAQDLPGSSLCQHPRCDVHRDATDVVA